MACAAEGGWGESGTQGLWACSEGTRGRPACAGTGTCSMQVAARSGGERGSCFPSWGPPQAMGFTAGVMPRVPTRVPTQVTC